jgi:cytochrome c oxidase subunit 2
VGLDLRPRRPDGELDTADDIAVIDELHVEVGKTLHFRLESTDVLHSASPSPIFRLKQDAVPGRHITGWFQPTITGEYDIQCAEMCGIGHGVMGARIFIETPDQHKKPGSSRPPRSPSPP